MNSSAYKEQGIDLKRLALVSGRKLKLVAAVIIFGAIIGALIYEGVIRIIHKEKEYRIVSKM